MTEALSDAECERLVALIAMDDEALAAQVDDQFRALLSDRAALAERVERLTETVKSCQVVFAEYAELHRQKLGTPSRGISQAERDDIHRKIDRNRDMSDLCLAAHLTKGEQAG